MTRYSLVYSGPGVSGFARVLAALIVPVGFFTVALAGHAVAADGFDNQAEWAQGYDADEHLAVPRSTTPVLSPQTFTACSMWRS